MRECVRLPKKYKTWVKCVNGFIRILSLKQSTTTLNLKLKMETAMDATQYIALSELNDSATQLAFRPSYDLLWDQLTSEALIAFKKLEQEGNASVPVIMPLWRLIQHLRDELCVIRKVANQTVNFVTDLKAHEEMIKRQKVERSRHRAEKQMLKKMADVATEPNPPPTQIE